MGPRRQALRGPDDARADRASLRFRRAVRPLTTVDAAITFAKNDKTPVERRNAVCLTCHTAGKHLFWKGSAHESRDVACTSCHTVMTNVSAKSQLKRPTEMETCGTCHAQKAAAVMA